MEPTPEQLTEAVQSGQISQKDYDAAIAKITSSPLPPGSPPTPPPAVAETGLNERDVQTMANDIDEMEASGKITPEQAARYRSEAGIEKTEPKPAALAELEKIHGEPASKPTDFVIPKFLDNPTEKEALEATKMFTAAMLAGEVTPQLGNSLANEFQRAFRMSEHWSESEKEFHATDSMRFMEKRFGADLPAMMARGKSFWAHIQKSVPAIGEYIKASGALDFSPMALSLFLQASENWHKRQKAKGKK